MQSPEHLYKQIKQPNPFNKLPMWYALLWFVYIIGYFTLISGLIDIMGLPKLNQTTQATTMQPSSVKLSGMKCSGSCGEFNSYAEPNQADGSYCCFSYLKK